MGIVSLKRRLERLEAIERGDRCAECGGRHVRAYCELAEIAYKVECGDGDPDEPLCGCACCSWWVELAQQAAAAEAEERG